MPAQHAGYARCVWAAGATGRTREGWRPHNDPHFPRYWGRFVCHGNLCASRKARPTEKRPDKVERAESLHKEGAAFSLIGQLSHACRAVRAGRSFLRRLIDLSMGPKQLDHYVRFNMEARSDIEWWAQYASRWNGMAMMHVLNRSSPGDFRCLWSLGMWGVLRPQLVHAQMGWPHQWPTHHRQGIGTQCDSWCIVGILMEGDYSTGSVRQYSSGEHRQPGDIEESRCNASCSVPSFY